MACGVETTSCDDVHDALGTDGSKWDDIVTTSRVVRALEWCENREVDIDPKYESLCHLGVVIYSLQRDCNTKWNEQCKISENDVRRAYHIASDMMLDSEDLLNWSSPDRRRRQLANEREFLAEHIRRIQSPRDERYHQLPRLYRAI